MRCVLVDGRNLEVAADLNWLQSKIFPSDESLDPSEGFWWIVYDGDIPAAFASLRDVPSWSNTGYMARCGVLSKYRGQGLQKRLLVARERKAKSIGLQRVITTTYRNPPSANNLIRRGFVTYLPHTGWGASDTIYWRKDFK